MSHYVIIVEGEKCVAALERLGVPATTTWGGAGKAGLTDWSTLGKKQRVYLWPDNDEAGRKHMEDIKAEGHNIQPECEIRIIDIDVLDLKPKEDVCDLLALLGDVGKEVHCRAIEDLISDSIGSGADDHFHSHLKDIYEGKFRAEPLPFPTLNRMCKAFVPGTVVVIGGSPGATKSFFVLDVLQTMHTAINKVPVAVFELEDDTSFHMRRVIAQRCQRHELSDLDWILAHKDEMETIYNSERGFIKSFGARIWDAPDKRVYYKDLVDWVKARCEDGTRIIVIDPITAVSYEGQQHVEDLKFIFDVKTLVRKHGATLVMVTHPRKQPPSKGKPSRPTLDDLAGGTAFQRFTHTVLWFQYLDKEQSESCEVLGEGISPKWINRVVTIMKARNGRGAGKGVGFTFNANTFRFEEKGLIVS